MLLAEHVDGGANKSGVPPEELPALAHAVAALPRLRLRGLMCIPEATDDLPRLREQFACLPTLQAALAGYETGKVDFAAVLDAQRQIRRAREDLVRAKVLQEMRRADIERALGEEL
jgi:D-serine deaminase-like pyridoxal phosphate-dependent protein